ncbi:MAG: AAA family ATPase [Paludibacteraceae bacterium]|nr:AAA family ATPase [Paludibacteraceae bacterium]
MLEKFIKNRILNALPFAPNEGQGELLDLLSQFVVSKTDFKAFVLRGYAGTGKTSIIAALVRAMQELKQSIVLLAPTGRAAKVLSRYAHTPAYTIHKYIYRQDKLGAEDFSLSYNPHRQAIFVVDEASMISSERDNGTFGTGILLNDLIKYVYSGEGCSLLLLGDDAQLPPVGSELSPALDIDYLSGYGLSITSYTLTQVARQALDSGILHNATTIRNLLMQQSPLSTDSASTIYHFTTDFQEFSGVDFLELLEQSYREVGTEDTIILTRTNRRTNLYNQGVRARILWKEDAISTGDRLMISKNNYFWTQDYEDIPFLANGDMMEIVRLRNCREIYGFQFADASLRAIDYDWEIDVILWLDTLITDSPEINNQLHRQLFDRISEDYPELQHNRKKLIKTIYESPYYNALQVRFAYAVTCHKAQGGQWKRVFIDPGKIPVEEHGKNYYRWLYTAVTRATERVYLLTNLAKK